MPVQLASLPVDTFLDRGATYKVTVTVHKCLPGGTVEDKEEEPHTRVHVISAPVVVLAVEEALSEAVMEVQKLLIEETDSEEEEESFDGSVSDPE